MGTVKIVTLADDFQSDYNHIVMSGEQETVCGLDIRRYKVLKLVSSRLTCPQCFDKMLKTKETATTPS